MPERTPASILLIEDNLGDAALVREALEEHGVVGELLVIDDGDKAIRHIHTLEEQEVPCPGLTIIDLNLPKRSGLEVLQAMRASIKCKDAVVVVFSSGDTARDRGESIELGASQYVRKPLHLDEFLNLGGLFKELLGQ